MRVGQGNPPNNGALLAQDGKSVASEKWLGIEADIRAQLGQAALCGLLVNILHQVASNAHVACAGCYKELINIAFGLSIGIAQSLPQRIDGDKGAQLLKAQASGGPVWGVGCPGLSLGRAVMGCCELVHGAVKHLPQDCGVAGLKTSYMHGCADGQMLRRMALAACSTHTVRQAEDL